MINIYLCCCLTTLA